MASIRQEFANLSTTQLVVHVVAAKDPIPLHNKFLKVLFKARKENEKHRYANKGKCNLNRPHCHYLVCLKVPHPVKRDNYMVRLNTIMIREFLAKLLQLN
jgi:hypothetical protein